MLWLRWFPPEDVEVAVGVMDDAAGMDEGDMTAGGDVDKEDEDRGCPRGKPAGAGVGAAGVAADAASPEDDDDPGVLLVWGEIWLGDVTDPVSSLSSVS